jgi:hypothetical protein
MRPRQGAFSLVLTMAHFRWSLTGVNIHTCLAVTPEGIVLGVLDQVHYNREEAKETKLTPEAQRMRPIEEKESYRWLTTMAKANKGLPEGLKMVHVCDREGDIYELFDEAEQTGYLFLIRLVQNRKTMDNKKVLDEVGKKAIDGQIKVIVPRDSRRVSVNSDQSVY